MWVQKLPKILRLKCGFWAVFGALVLVDLVDFGGFWWIMKFASFQP
ncbi:MAG: hypothetical protein FWG68_01945 [Defluviitaleaceae bacterium]|nr:hypothetical protein [Defluviitaleaceae bacterium]